MPKTIEEDRVIASGVTIRMPWTIRHPSCDGSGQCDTDPEDGQPDHTLSYEIHTEPGELDDAKRETESAALFVAGLVIVCICACLGLWLSFVVGG